MKITKFHQIFIILGIFIMGISFIPRYFLEDVGENIFLLLIGTGIIVITFPFIYSLIRETQKAKEKEEMFLEFSRNLVESVKTGTPISKSIINVSNKNYLSLTPHVKKLANQISLGIPLANALKTFAKEVGNKNISKAITLIGQAEKSGGEIGTILESVAESVSSSEKLKKERKSKIQTLTSQGYIIFTIFIIIILVIQYFVLPMLSGIDISEQGESITDSEGLGSGTGIDEDELGNAFLYLLIVQGFFSGLTIGKLSEKNFIAGLKHSFILVVMAFMIYATARVVSGFIG